MGSAFIAICRRRAASASHLARESREMVHSQPVTEYRNGLILLAIDRNSGIGRVTF